MIAKSALLILEMIHESPKGAYEINKLLDTMNVKWWLPISHSAIYTTIRSLEQKKYITGHPERNGNMPERTVYTITDLGTKTLTDAVKEIFLTVEFDTTTFSIVSVFIDSMNPEELEELLTARRQILTEYLQGITANIEAMTPSGNHSIVLSVIRMKEIVEVELSYVNTLLSEKKSKPS